MSQESIVEIPRLAIRPQADFHALPERGRPGGTSPDSQYFALEETIWIGKSSMQALFKPEARHPLFNAYYEEYKEWLGLMMYRLFGIPTPMICLSQQRPIKPEERAVEDFDYERPCLHIMSQFVEGFRPCGEHFLSHYRQAVASKAEAKEKVSDISIVLVEGESVPLRGFGAALAVGCFIYDLDCLGRSGGNMGYVIETDAHGQRYAKIVKIDPGFAFSFIEQFDDPAYQQDDPRRRVIRFAPGKMQGGQVCIIRYDELSMADQREFAQAARKILQTPKAVFEAVIRQVVVSDGLTRKQADQLLTGLLARKTTFLNGFAPEVSRELCEEALRAHTEFLRAMVKPTAAIRLSESNVIGHDHKEWKEGKTYEGKASREKEQTLDREQKERKEEKEEKENKFRPAGLPVVHPAYLSSSVDDDPPFASISSKPINQKAELKPPESSAKSSQVLMAQLAAQESQLAREQLELEVKRIQGQKPDEKSSRCQMFQPPVVAPHFTGREEILAKLAQELHTGQGAVITQGISGLGGVGKTQLVSRYAQLAAQGEKIGERQLAYQAVVWIRAEQSIGPQFQALAEAWCNQTNLPEKDALQVVYRHLRGKRVLLVFDNAQDVQSLSPYFPPAATGISGLWQRLRGGTIHVLITSRNPHWQDIPTVALEGFSQQEAYTYVRQRLPAAIDEEINRLLESVSVLPLPLSHAVAYVAAGYCSLAEYPQQFALHQLSLGGMVQAALGLDNTVLTTFLLSATRLEQTHPGTLSLLRSIAYLAPEAIPQSLLQAAWVKTDQPPDRFEVSIMALTRQSLLQRDAGGQLYVHRLVQQVMRQSLSVSDQERQLIQVMQLLAETYPQKGVGHAADAARMAYLPHLQVMVAHQDRSGPCEEASLATVLAHLGDIYTHLGDAAKQRDLLERALAIREAHYGRDHYEVASTLGNLGTAYGALGDVAKQRALLERALAIREAHYGRDHYQVASILGNLGTTYGALGDVAKQRALLERALAIKEAHYGRDHYEVAITLLNLGTAYGELGDVTKQRALLERALAIKEVHYGRDHYGVATTLTNLGNMYGALGDVAKQRALLERALAINEAHYGRDHYQVASTLNGLGNAYGALGDVAKKRDLLERALAIKEAHYSRDHYEVAITLVNLGNAYGALGDAAKQRDLLERALAIQEAHYGRDHYEVAITLLNLGNAYSALGDVAKQRALLERALAIQEAHYGRDHYQMAIILNNLGVAYGTLGDVTEKRALLERALAIDEAHYGRDHPELAYVLGNLAVAYYRLQQPQAALQAAQRTYHLLMSHPDYGASHPLTEQFLSIFKSSCGFSDAQLRGESSLSNESSHPQDDKAHHRQDEIIPRTDAKRLSVTTVPTLPSKQGLASRARIRKSEKKEVKLKPSTYQATSLRECGMLYQGNRQARRFIGQSIIHFVHAMTKYMEECLHGEPWKEYSAATIVADVVTVLSEGVKQYQALLEEPEKFKVPAPLIPFIIWYVEKHPKLSEIGVHQKFVVQTAKELRQGSEKILELQQRFGIPKPEQKPVDQEERQSENRNKQGCCVS